MPFTRPLLFVTLFLCECSMIFAQEAIKKHNYRLYFHWGYNRSAYSNANLHLKGGNDFDFTVHRVKALDVPEKYSSSVYLNPSKITIPQFNFRVGVQLDNKWSISGGWDHLKYRLIGDQTVSVTGQINQGEYTGTYNHSPVVMDYRFLRMEHTDGLNYIHVNLDRHFNLYQSKNQLFRAEVLAGAGTGPVCPWTDTRLFGEFYRNPSIHFAGWGISVNATTRITLWNRFFVEHMVRVGHINLWDIMIIRNKYSAETKINYFERNITAGFLFPLTPSKNGNKQLNNESIN